MAYIPTKWENEPSTNTPLDADNLNHIEQGIKSAHDSLDSVSTGKLDKTAVVQVTGSSTTSVMSQNAATKAFQPNGDYLSKGDYGIGTEVTFNGDSLFLKGSSDSTGLRLIKSTGETALIRTGNQPENIFNIDYLDGENTRVARIAVPKATGTMMLVGDYGWGGKGVGLSYSDEDQLRTHLRSISTPSSVFRCPTLGSSLNYIYSAIAYFKAGNTFTAITANHTGAGVKAIGGYDAADVVVYNLWTDRNATKDSNGNLKAASPVVKLFADDIELNDESEGVEMEHLGIGHYLIKGVVSFNADGAWGINNGFVIPQDHNGKNMVLIDYEVRPDGDIEVFVFHQQNADMPERFQNKRIKHFDEEGVPVYFENYEPCDIPESRWIDMRVEMPVNSIYNLKQAEAERLAKEVEESEKTEGESPSEPY